MGKIQSAMVDGSGWLPVFTLLKRMDVTTKNLIKTAPYDIANNILDELKELTPKYSGVASKSWEIKGISEGKVQISNSASYSKYLEYGSFPGEHPWPSTGERTVHKDEKIWSSQAPGGMTQKLDTNFINKAIHKYIMSMI